MLASPYECRTSPFHLQTRSKYSKSDAPQTESNCLLQLVSTPFFVNLRDSSRQPSDSTPLQIADFTRNDSNHNRLDSLARERGRPHSALDFRERNPSIPD